jgi:hypothetical protein
VTGAFTRAWDKHQAQLEDIGWIHRYFEMLTILIAEDNGNPEQDMAEVKIRPVSTTWAVRRGRTKVLAERNSRPYKGAETPPSPHTNTSPDGRPLRLI